MGLCIDTTEYLHILVRSIYGPFLWYLFHRFYYWVSLTVSKLIFRWFIWLCWMGTLNQSEKKNRRNFIRYADKESIKLKSIKIEKLIKIQVRKLSMFITVGLLSNEQIFLSLQQFPRSITTEYRIQLIYDSISVQRISGKSNNSIQFNN